MRLPAVGRFAGLAFDFVVFFLLVGKRIISVSFFVNVIFHFMLLHNFLYRLSAVCAVCLQGLSLFLFQSVLFLFLVNRPAVGSSCTLASVTVYVSMSLPAFGRQAFDHR